MSFIPDRDEQVRTLRDGRVPSLKRLAAVVARLFPDLTPTVEPSWSSTDQSIPGTRLRRLGRGRHGNKLVVLRKGSGELAFEHDSSQTYRHNREVLDWIADELKVRVVKGVIR